MIFFLLNIVSVTLAKVAAGSKIVHGSGDMIDGRSKEFTNIEERETAKILNEFLTREDFTVIKTDNPIIFQANDFFKLPEGIIRKITKFGMTKAIRKEIFMLWKDRVMVKIREQQRKTAAVGMVMILASTAFAGDWWVLFIGSSTKRFFGANPNGSLENFLKAREAVQKDSSMLDIASISGIFALLSSFGFTLVSGILSDFLYSNAGESSLDQAEKLWMKYAGLKVFLPGDLQGYTEFFLDKIPIINDRSHHVVYLNFIESLLKQAELLSKGLLHKHKPMFFDIDKVKANLQSFDQSIVDLVVDYLAVQLQGASIKMPFLFLGPPGTGKTYLISLIAKILDLPYRFVSFEGKKYSELLGEDFRSSDSRIVEGEIIKAILSFEGKKGILILDEAVKSINSSKEMYNFALKLLEPSTKTIFAPFLSCSIPVNNLIIFIADNEYFKDSALQNRVITVKFNGYSPGVKYKILISKNLPALAKMYNTTLKGFDFALFRKIVNSLKEPGFRIVNKIAREMLIDKMVLETGLKHKTALDFLNIAETEEKLSHSDGSPY